MSTFGKRKGNTKDWAEAHSDEMIPLIEEKRLALAYFKNLPSKKKIQILRATRSKVQQTARRCANYYWLQLCSQIQMYIDVGHIKGM